MVYIITSKKEHKRKDLIMKDIKVITTRGGRQNTYTDANNKYEVTICRRGKYYCGWYYVNEVENGYQGKSIGDTSEWDIWGVIAMLINYAREDELLTDSRKKELEDLLCKIWYFIADK